MSSIPSWAVRGAKVVCVDDWNAQRGVKWFQITKGERYTIAGAVDDELGAYLAIEETSDRNGDYGLWRVARFRPLITQQDDIDALFKALLDVPEQAGV